MTQSTQNADLLSAALSASAERTFFSHFPENPKSYPDDAQVKGLVYFQSLLNSDFNPLNLSDFDSFHGEEVSPFLATGLGIQYPLFSVENLINTSLSAKNEWEYKSVKERFDILFDALNSFKNRFFDMAFATMHTTGQSFLMSFQASGPHACDRALESMVLGYQELTRFSSDANWVKSFGKFDLTINKKFKPIPKGIGLVIGCSTFPSWNSVPGIFANLICGNTVFGKPHPKAVLPAAIIVEILQKTFVEHGLNPGIIQLATDSSASPITKKLVEHPSVSLIDYTGGNSFGNYIESVKGKTVFTEKAGINSVLVHSTNDLNKVAANIAFSICLYSGQMCTAPQNIYVSKNGIVTPDGIVTVSDFKNMLAEAVKNLVNNPKAGPGTLGAVQNNTTFKRSDEIKNLGLEIIIDKQDVVNPEFPDAFIHSPVILGVNASEKQIYLNECFGPVAFIVETESIEESIAIASKSAMEKGAITCLAFCTDKIVGENIENTMNASFTPVTFNFEGAAFVNQHAAFSDFHVTGGNPAGNATFTDANFINLRFVWVGNRYMSA